MTPTQKRKGPAPGTIYAKLERPPTGEKILSLRRERGLSQTDLAKKTGLSKRMVSFYERESANIPAPKLELIAKALSISIDDLMGYQPNPLTLATPKGFLKKLEKAKQFSPEKQKIIAHLIDSLSTPRRKEINGVP